MQAHEAQGLEEAPKGVLVRDFTGPLLIHLVLHLPSAHWGAHRPQWFPDPCQSCTAVNQGIWQVWPFQFAICPLGLHHPSRACLPQNCPAGCSLARPEHRWRPHSLRERCQAGGQAERSAQRSTQPPQRLKQSWRSLPGILFSNLGLSPGGLAEHRLLGSCTAVSDSASLRIELK